MAIEPLPVPFSSYISSLVAPRMIAGALCETRMSPLSLDAYLAAGTQYNQNVRFLPRNRQDSRFVDEMGTEQRLVLSREDVWLVWRHAPYLDGSIHLDGEAEMNVNRRQMHVTYTARSDQRRGRMKCLGETVNNQNHSDFIVERCTAQNTAPLCPPERPPTNTATQRPMPSPSGSDEWRPCAGPARLGVVLGSQCGLFGVCIGVSVKSYTRVVKSLDVVQNM